MAAVETRDPHLLLTLVEIQVEMMAMTVIAHRTAKDQTGGPKKMLGNKPAEGEQHQNRRTPCKIWTSWGKL